ncbi:MAG TPA: Stk1 family PASTA domain-containing Ser/Thr kinase [Actinomycetes bacterium]|nr:Stk1 family PASTA domain-containing Ser/Thr kinase [Actinomycetes bacterium]
MGTTPQVLLGRYEVGRLLGAGGMAEVYEGHDRLLDRRVAIKVLLAQYAHDPAFLTRFRREAQAAASLSHPNIVAVFDTGSQDDTWFIVMEYVAGRTLKDVIRTEGALYWARAAEIGGDVANALSAAHARGVVHRDIKPGNVMLTTDGKVKVMDFGIARASAVPSITQTAAVVGTAQYIAPEQAQGLEVDARSDLYALGCCLYEMLTGQVPFTGPTPVAIAYRHVREDPTPPRMLNPDVPESLELVCLKAMAKRPEDRYQTALEMRQDLERVRTGQPVSVGVPLASQATQAIGEQAHFADSQTATLGAGSSMGGDQLLGYGQEMPLPRRSSAGWVVAAILALLIVGFAAFLITRAFTAPTRTTQTSLTATTQITTTSEVPTSSTAPTTSERATTTSERPTTTSRPTTTASSSTAASTSSASPSTTSA